MTRSSTPSAFSRAASHAVRRARSASTRSSALTRAPRAFRVRILAGSGAPANALASSRRATRSSSKSADVSRRSSRSAWAGAAVALTSAAAGIAVAVVVMVAEREAWAGAPTEQLRTQIDRAIKVLEDPEMAKESHMVERRTAIRRIANEIFDFTETTRRSLGTHWQVRTPQERDEVTRLFADLLERSYIGRIETYSGERIQFLGDTIDGDQTTVRSRLITKQGMEIPVDYRMHRASGDRWLTYDVAIEGVSLVANYRAQFNKIIQTSGYTSLVKKLAAKEQEGMQADRELTVKKASQTR